MSAYKEFNGKSVEEALKAARDEFGEPMTMSLFFHPSIDHESRR